MPSSYPAANWLADHDEELRNIWERYCHNACDTGYPSEKLIEKLSRSKYWDGARLTPAEEEKLEPPRMATARRALKNLCLDCVRHMRHADVAQRTPGAFDSVTPEQPTTPAYEVEEILTAEVWKERLERAVQEMKDGPAQAQINAFILMVLDDLTKEQAAEKLGSTPGAVQRAKNIASKKIKAVLQDRVEQKNKAPKGGNNK